MPDELERVEEEAAGVGTDLQVATAALSIGLSFLAILLTTPIPSIPKFTVFVCITVVSFAMGLYCWLRWKRQGKSLSRTLQKIRDRQIGPVGTGEERMSTADLQESAAEQAPKDQE